MEETTLIAQVEKSKQELAALYERLGDFPGNGRSHYIHMSENLATGAAAALDTSKICWLLGKPDDAHSFLTMAEKSKDALRAYFRLLDSFPEYREAEVTSDDGLFPELSRMDRCGKDYHKFYVEESERRLRKG